jgi:hypothetical protein
MLQVLDTRAFSQALFGAAETCASEVRIFSAFVRSNALRSLAQRIGVDVPGQVIARWRPRDILSGASDMGAYKICRELGWRFGVNLNLHAKAYFFDGKSLLVGSGNLTDSGMGLVAGANEELGVFISEPKITDLENLRKFEAETVWLDDQLFSQIEFALSDLSPDSTNDRWPDHLTTILKRPVVSLWVADLIAAMPEGAFRSQGAQSLDGLGSYRDQENCKRFAASRLHTWLVERLTNANTYTNFGWLTSQLHDALIDDPKPSRISVKDHVASIFSWIEVCGSGDIVVKHHQHTKSLLLSG